MFRILTVSVIALCFSTTLVLAQSSESVRQAQQSLKDKGFDPGPVDGVYGPNTEHALRQYQQQEKLTDNGLLDDRTMDSLGVNRGTAGGEMHAAGRTIEHSYANGGKKMGEGGKALGHDIKHGEVVDGAKDFGKDVGHGAKDIGVGTGHAAKDAAKGVKDGVTKDKTRTDH